MIGTTTRSGIWNSMPGGDLPHHYSTPDVEPPLTRRAVRIPEFGAQKPQRRHYRNPAFALRRKEYGGFTDNWPQFRHLMR
jgi:hypothetical protein